MKVAVIDDDPHFSELLEARLAQLCQSNGDEAQISCFNHAAKILRTEDFTKYDIIFLDIAMPDIDGLEVAKKLNALRGDSPTPYIVFVSSKDNLVFEALHVYPYSFIRKSNLSDLDACMLSLSKTLNSMPIYTIQHAKSADKLDINSIIYIIKEKNYSVFYTKNGIFRERTGINSVQSRLKGYNFLRPHEGALINADHLSKLQSNIITMCDGFTMHVSRSYRATFKKEFHEWVLR